MRIGAIREDNVVIVEGRSMTVDLSAYDWRAVQLVDGDGFVEHETEQVAVFATPLAGALFDAWDAVRATIDTAAAGVPKSVTRAQFRLALLDLDLLDDVEAMVAASNDRDLQINWQDRQEFERNHPLVIATAAALGKTAAEIDALFVLAASK